VLVSGADAVSYLQGQCSQDVSRLTVGESADALLLSPQGRVDVLLRVTRTAETELVLDTDGGFGQAMIDRLNRFKLRVKVDISPLIWGSLGVRGPDAANFASTHPGVLRLQSSWPGLDGFDLLGAKPPAPAGLEICSQGAWNAFRIEAGIPVMGAEIDDKTIAQEAGLIERCVSFTKGCFTGQELVARLDSRGSNVARRLSLLTFESDPRGKAEVEIGAEVFSGEKSVGKITSSAWSPQSGSPVALAYIHRSVTEPATVRAGDLNAKVTRIPLGA
jgi:folate-binding protein YgfZ